MSGGAARRSLRQDAAIALGIALVLAVLYALTWRASLFDDGEVFAHYFVSSDRQVWYHVLYLPLARGLHSLVPSDDHLAGLKALSVFSAAMGVALSYLAARGLGCARRSSLFAAGLLAVSPALWFFGTTIELHATHFAAVALAATGTIALGRAPFVWHLVGAALLFPLLYLTHNSGALFGVGWVLLFALARKRAGQTIGAFRLWFVAAPVLLAGLVLAICFTNLYLGRGFGLGAGGTLDYVLGWRGDHRPDLRFFGEELVFAYAALLLLMLTALASGAVPRPVVWMSAAAALPVAAFFVWFAYPSRGGYFSGVAFFVFLLVAHLRLERWPRPALAALFVLGWGSQGAVGWARMQAFERSQLSGRVDVDRVAMVRERLTPLLEGRRGALISLWPVPRAIQHDVPAWVEIPLSHSLRAYAGPPPDLEGFAAPVLRQVDEHLASGGWIVAVDVPEPRLYASNEAAEALIGGFVRAVRERYRTREIRHREHLFLLLEAKGP